MPGADSLQLRIDRKDFAGTAILRSINVHAQPGEFLALLAPSGTGKTTALRILLGLDTAFTGSVITPAGRAAAVFQEPRLLPWLNIAANLRLVAPALTDSQVQDLLTAMDLPGIAALLPRQISLGMARRVSLARALAVSPSLLVLDEPFASLDARLSARLATAITTTAKLLNAVVVMATHDLPQALIMADRVLILTARPATLAADLAVPAEPARAAFADDLRRRFPFLDAAGAPSAFT
jgi:ABC-type nitrate/sulfonate/bicarbonate transport system ATPase subunit